MLFYYLFAEIVQSKGWSELLTADGILCIRSATLIMRSGAVWLRPRKDTNWVEQIRVADLERRVERLATPDEVERGTFYENYEHYQKRNTA